MQIGNDTASLQKLKSDLRRLGPNADLLRVKEQLGELSANDVAVCAYAGCPHAQSLYPQVIPEAFVDFAVNLWRFGQESLIVAGLAVNRLLLERKLLKDTSVSRAVLTAVEAYLEGPCHASRDAVIAVPIPFANEQLSLSSLVKLVKDLPKTPWTKASKPGDFFHELHLFRSVSGQIPETTLKQQVSDALLTHFSEPRPIKLGDRHKVNKGSLSLLALFGDEVRLKKIFARQKFSKHEIRRAIRNAMRANASMISNILARSNQSAQRFSLCEQIKNAEYADVERQLSAFLDIGGRLGPQHFKAAMSRSDLAVLRLLWQSCEVKKAIRKVRFQEKSLTDFALEHRDYEFAEKLYYSAVPNINLTLAIDSDTAISAPELTWVKRCLYSGWPADRRSIVEILAETENAAIRTYIITHFPGFSIHCIVEAARLANIEILGLISFRVSQTDLNNALNYVVSWGEAGAAARLLSAGAVADHETVNRALVFACENNNPAFLDLFASFGLSQILKTEIVDCAEHIESLIGPQLFASTSRIQDIVSWLEDQITAPNQSSSLSSNL